MKKFTLLLSTGSILFSSIAPAMAIGCTQKMVDGATSHFAHGKHRSKPASQGQKMNGHAFYLDGEELKSVPVETTTKRDIQSKILTRESPYTVGCFYGGNILEVYCRNQDGRFLSSSVFLRRQYRGKTEKLCYFASRLAEDLIEARNAVPDQALSSTSTSAPSKSSQMLSAAVGLSTVTSTITTGITAATTQLLTSTTEETSSISHTSSTAYSLILNTTTPAPNTTLSETETSPLSTLASTTIDWVTQNATYVSSQAVDWLNQTHTTAQEEENHHAAAITGAVLGTAAGVAGLGAIVYHRIKTGHWFWQKKEASTKKDGVSYQSVSNSVVTGLS